MRARACCDAGSMGRFLRSIIAVMDDVRWRPEDFIVVMVYLLLQSVHCCWRVLRCWCSAAAAYDGLQR